jgi:AcrR family transcriptional regulator
MPSRTPDTDIAADTAAGADGDAADWQARVVRRSLRTATQRSIDRGTSLVRAAARLLERTNGDRFTVQDVADEAGQSLRTLYQYFESKDDLLLAVFEEAMRAYAQLIRTAIADLTDPVERLAGAMVAAVRMPEYRGGGVDRGLARLRLRLAETKPVLVGRAQASLTSLVRELIDDTIAAGRAQVADPEAATFMLLSLNASVITADTLGNDAGVRRPDVASMAGFCLRGLGAELDDGWYESVAGRLRFPAAARSAPAKRAARAGRDGRSVSARR